MHHRQLADGHSSIYQIRINSSHHQRHTAQSQLLFHRLSQYHFTTEVAEETLMWSDGICMHLLRSQISDFCIFHIPTSHSLSLQIQLPICTGASGSDQRFVFLRPHRKCIHFGASVLKERRQDTDTNSHLQYYLHTHHFASYWWTLREWSNFRSSLELGVDSGGWADRILFYVCMFESIFEYDGES